MEHHDLLIEILTEELPPKRLSLLETAFADSIRQQLLDAKLSFLQVKSYSTARRLAVIVEKLAEQQLPQKIEHKGPSLSIAFDNNQQLTPAGLGFLKKCHITVEQLSTIQTDKGECLYFSGEKSGLSVDQLIPDIIKKSLKELPIPKPMRWANHNFSFVRPVHSTILLYGERIIPAEFFGKLAHRCTQGHRQHCHDSINISLPENYAEELEEKGCVIVNSAERKAMILEQIDITLQALSEATHRDQLKIAITDQQEYDDLFNEVTALVEWPKVLLCRFNEIFLNIPKEALMASMQGHQKCFAIADKAEKLLPYFITVSNLQSQDETAVIRGNERVMHARLSDAKFFYESDLKETLENHTPRLANTIYQETLGTLKDKVDRVTRLAIHLALNQKEQKQAQSVCLSVQRAAQLCKLDLFSHMVGEFPELQGIMGKYYAQQQGESAEVATAIEEHYWPRFADDKIPTATVSVTLALADRLDTMIGFFSVGLTPTGDKDPFGLKRAALSVLKIIIENKLNVSLQEILIQDNLIDFFKERFKTIVLEKNISLDVFNAILNVVKLEPHDNLLRMQALQKFKTNTVIETLIQANKRVKNFLLKNQQVNVDFSLDTHLLEKDIEKILTAQISQTETEIKPLIDQANYAEAFALLANLKPAIDQFFDEVMIMTEDLKQRHNRLALLKKLDTLFARVADFSVLQ